jgi:hypothetical protein
MATLRNFVTGKQIVLRTCHIFGRNPFRSDTLLPGKDISQIHASIQWNGNRWEISDHSRNGILLDGRPPSNRKRIALAIGNRIQFGAAKDAIWDVGNLNAPRPVLVPLQKDAVPIELGPVNFLPDDSSPEMSIYVENTGQWVRDDNHEITMLKDGDIVDIGRSAWKFIWALNLESTLEIKPDNSAGLGKMFLQFQVSLDEEHVHLTLSTEGREIDLGERVHHYCLLTLARQRLEDAKKGIDSNNQGWLDLERLSKMIGLDIPHLNIHIFRIRSQFAQALPDQYFRPNIIERRRGGARFGSFSFNIVRGSRIEGQFEPKNDDLKDVSNISLPD